MNLTQGGRGCWKQEKAEMDDYSWRKSQRPASFVLLISDIGFSELDNLFERNERNSSTELREVIWNLLPLPITQWCEFKRI